MKRTYRPKRGRERKSMDFAVGCLRSGRRILANRRRKGRKPFRLKVVVSGLCLPAQGRVLMLGREFRITSAQEYNNIYRFGKNPRKIYGFNI